MLPLTPTTPADTLYNTRPQTLPTNITDTPSNYYEYEAQMIRSPHTADTADDDTADSDPIYQAFSWHIQIFFLYLHAE